MVVFVGDGVVVVYVKVLKIWWLCGVVYGMNLWYVNSMLVFGCFLVDLGIYDLKDYLFDFEGKFEGIVVLGEVWVGFLSEFIEVFEIDLKMISYYVVY